MTAITDAPHIRNKHPRGQLVTIPHKSDCLGDNPWRDPVERLISVYLPPGYSADSATRYPVVWYLAAYTNSGLSVGNWRGFDETLPERLDRLIATNRIGPLIVVAPDCFTRLGGNQYVDSAAVGRYESYINDELVPFIDSRFNTLADPAHRGVMGKSSGGYGALRFAMERPGVWGAVANHSGDAGFDWVYQPEFPTAAAVLARYDHEVERFLDVFWGSRSRGGADFSTLMCCCLAASYDPEPGGASGITLPFDTSTLELDRERWLRWEAYDPINEVRTRSHNLQQLRGIYMDCGNRDQYNIHFGLRRLSRELKACNVNHTYEEFDGTHSKIDHRLDKSFPFLFEHLS